LTGAVVEPYVHVLLGIDSGEDSRRALDETVAQAKAARDDLTIAVLTASEASTSTSLTPRRRRGSTSPRRLGDLRGDAASSFPLAEGS